MNIDQQLWEMVFVGLQVEFCFLGLQKCRHSICFHQFLMRRI